MGFLLNGTTSGFEQKTTALNPPTPGDHSVCMFFRTDSALANATLWQLETGGAAGGHEIQLGATGLVLTYSSETVLKVTGPAIVLRQWYFVGLTVLGTNATLYSAPLGAGLTSGSTTTATPISTVDTLSIGAQDAASAPFNGTISDVKLWAGVALSASEMFLESKQRSPRRIGNLFAYWDCLTNANVIDRTGRALKLVSNVVADTTQGPTPPIPWAVFSDN